MRTIKFKAWDAKNKRMFDPNNEAQTFGWYAAGKDPDVTLIQFTGLLDKNSKEIYEGDILRWNKNTLCVVVFEKGAFGGRFLGHTKNNSWVNLSILEVIGNIYENPELLEHTGQKNEAKPLL